MKFQRKYEDLETYLNKNEVLIIYGPRRVGKTFLIENYLKDKNKYLLVTGDDIDARNILSSQSLSALRQFVEGYKMLVIDEAQRIPDIGWGVKLIVDKIPGVKVILTGSSTLKLSSELGEPLTDRATVLKLFPLSLSELNNHYNKYELALKTNDLLVYGSYPGVLQKNTHIEKQRKLVGIVQSYLLKDILELERVKNSKKLLDVLRLLAFQVGSDISLNEIAEQVALDVKTIQRYLDLMEKSFIIYNLRGYSKNLRDEIVSKSKYFFYDNGVRNAIISNFNGLELRDDIGKLWENFVVMERIKFQNYNDVFANNYFWKDWSGKEVDWVEEKKGTLEVCEFKYNPKVKYKLPTKFKENYKSSSFKVIHRDNFVDWLV